MLTISRLFGRSPFSPLRTHMHKVAECVEKLPALFKALEAGDQQKVEEIASQISSLEHAADLTKNDIRNRLPKGLFLPVDRGSLLEILGIQDSIADRAEDIGLLLTLRKLDMIDSIRGEFDIFVEKNIEAFKGAEKIVQELEELLQSSFGGFEAEKVKLMVDDVAFKEHEADIIQHKLLKHLFEESDALPHWSLYLWLRVLEGIAAISNLSEKLGNRVRMILDLK